jgi:CHAT domain-containing protein
VQKGTADAEAERTLRERLWAPLARALPKGTRELVVAPDGQLALLPLEALRLDDGRFLIETYQVRYVGNGRDLLPRPRPDGPARPPVLLADPDYDAAGPADAGGAKKPSAAPPQPGSRAPAAGLRFQPLPGFAREADAVTRLLQGSPGDKVRSLRGAAATEEALRAVQRPRLLYLVTHGFFLEDRPPVSGSLGLRKLELVALGTAPPQLRADARLRSGLALAGANKAQERSAKGLSDGLLTALEVENLDLFGTELVVLSACETGVGQVQVGEGVLGLRRAFQLAGAQTVLASLWQVPDQETERLMTDCLGRWLKGAAPAEGLRQAQLELIREMRRSTNANRQAAPPLYWAGFICHGQP